MAAHDDERETTRILRTVDLAFSNAARSNVLELERGQQARRTRTGSVSVVFGGLLGLAAVAALGLVAWDQRRPPPRPVEQDVGVVKPFTAAAPKVATADTGQRPVKPAQATETRRPSVASRTLSSAADLTTGPTDEPAAVKIAPAGNRYIADPLTGDALRRALIEDGIRTQALNRAELERLKDET